MKSLRTSSTPEFRPAGRVLAGVLPPTPLSPRLFPLPWLSPPSPPPGPMQSPHLTAAASPAELLRMSCGLEASEDLIADIAQALDKV